MNNLQARKPKNSIKKGDVIKLGEHFLLCGDARDLSPLGQHLKEHPINMICCDPPYGVAYVESKQGLIAGQKHKIIANDQEQTEEEYTAFTMGWLRAITPHLAEKNSIYIFNSDKMIFALRAAMLQSKYHFAQMLIWAKTQAIVGRMDYLPQHELIAYGWYGKHGFYKAKDKSILVCPKPSKSSIHPTMKPVSLIRRLILNSSKRGDVIYDPFGGSGTTLIACEQTKRRCITVELDPQYCQAIVDRWVKLTHANPIFL